MTLRRTALPLILLVLCLLAVVPSSLGQSESATLSGLITDPQGRVVPDVAVEVTEVDTNVSAHQTTNGAGVYVVVGLKPGRYRVSVTKDGFRKIDLVDLVLNVQDVLSRNFQLQLGSVLSSITVTADAASVNTTDASVSTVIDRQFVENIPLNGRSFQDLISMTPGLVTQSPQSGASVGTFGDFSVNGQRTESNYYSVDGVSGNLSAGNGYGAVQSPATSGSVAASTALGTTQSLISVDALQEFRVQSSTYSAEYGHSPGGQFYFVTRSGTNDFHGSAFDYLRNDAFDANDWFNDSYGQPKPALRQNDFGGTFGGPVWIPGLYRGKDKTFFFVSYEGLRLAQPQAAAIQYVPDLYMRQQAPAALQPILNAFPLPSPDGIDYGTAANPSLAQFIQSYSLPSQIDATSIRVDHIFGPKLSLFFRFGDTPSFTSSRTLSMLTRSNVNTQTYTLGLTSQLNGRFLNEFRLGYARTNANTDGSLDDFGGASPINLSAAMGLGSYSNSQVAFLLYYPDIGLSSIETVLAENRGRQWNVVDSISITSGHHSIKAGIDYRRIETAAIPANPLAEAEYASTGSVLNNAADIAVVVKSLSATPLFHETALFVQDGWRLSRRITLLLGLRWEVNPPPTEAHGNDAYTLDGSLSEPSTLVLAPRGTPLWNTSWYNFAPRLGVAWLLRDSPQFTTVLRGGGGVFFDTNNEAASSAFDGIGFTASNFYFGPALPLTTAQLDFAPSTTPPYTSSTIYAFPKHLQAPYTLQWNVSLEQALGTAQALTLSYVAADGRRLPGQQQLSLNALNPEFGIVMYLQGGVTSNYQALQAKFQRTISHGIQALASYTWSHSLDYGSNYSALPLIRGNSDFDVRNSFSGGASWVLPSLKWTKFGEAMLNHWGLDGRFVARSGFPITLYGNFLTDPVTGSSYYGNPNLVPSQPIYLYGSQYPGGRAINPAAFTLPPPGQVGDAPRNFVRGFGMWQVNMAVRREFPICEKLRIQFRAEAFNVLNHPNFGYVDRTLTDATFGRATQMLNQSLGTVSSQYQQGGPRSLQFALKLIF